MTMTVARKAKNKKKKKPKAESPPAAEKPGPAQCSAPRVSLTKAVLVKGTVVHFPRRLYVYSRRNIAESLHAAFPLRDNRIVLDVA